MNPIEKANELVSKTLSINLVQFNDMVDGLRMALARKCALITVDEIIKVLDNVSVLESGTLNIDYGQSYYKNVKSEIEKL